MNKIQKNHLFRKSIFIHHPLLKVLSIFILSSVNNGASANEFDQRLALPLNQAQQAHVLTEMRSLLAGTQAIVAALAADDMEAVAKHARLLGMGMKKKPENKLHGVLPKTFMMQGKAVHLGFDSIADDAESVKNSKHTLEQLSKTLSLCQGCHEMYRIEVNNTDEVVGKQSMESRKNDGFGEMKQQQLRLNQKENQL